jgi:hypothetical protein
MIAMAWGLPTEIVDAVVLFDALMGVSVPEP